MQSYNWLIKSSFFFLFVFCYNSNFAQSTDSTVIVKDSVQVEKQKKEEVNQDEVLPRRAAIRSAILPGWGQIQNKQLWKLPFVYGSLGTLGYLFVYNNKEYNFFKENYLAAKDDDPNTINSTSYSEATLKLNRDEFRKQRDMFVLATIGAYAVQIIDAYVFAHLKNFDISDDLSLSTNPFIFTNIATAPQLGFTIKLKF